jgi:hypothetical protein
LVLTLAAPTLTLGAIGACFAAVKDLKHLKRALARQRMIKDWLYLTRIVLYLRFVKALFTQ